MVDSAKRVRDAWLGYMNTKQLNTDHFVKTASRMVPLIMEAAGKLAALANMNRTVHLPTYNKLIASAAARTAA